MAIRFRCPGCGRPFEVRDQLAGKTAQCKQCGNRIQIPDAPAAAPAPPPPPAAYRPAEPMLDVYGLDDSGADREPAGPMTARGKGGWATRPVSDDAFDPGRTPKRASTSRASAMAPARSGRSSGFSFHGVEGLKGGLLLLLAIGLGLARGYFRHQRNNARANPQPAVVDAPAPAPFAPGPVAGPAPAPGGPAPAPAASFDGPIALPAFPNPGPARPVAAGVEVREVVFGLSGQAIPPGTAPGHAGKLWVYTPPGDHPARSLPCVFIAPAGTNLITGMIQGDGDRAEHLPWVRAGFAVVAYELDGYPGELQAAGDQALDRGIRQFLAARAGLVNARVAIEYALARIPEIDPDRLATAGHSSAAAVSVLVAENEPRIRACVAFAGPHDIADEVGGGAAIQLRRAGFGALVDRFSPSSGVASLGCPLFLFHAMDDTVVPPRQTQKFAADAQALGKDVTVKLVPRGGHYRPMIAEGLPAAIEWARQRLGPGSGN